LLHRWRSPKLLGGDFLGLSQAVKSVAATKNQFIKTAKTGNLKLSLKYCQQEF